MSIITKHHLSKEVFLLACQISEQGNPAITYDAIDKNNKAMQNLIKLKAFIVGKKYWMKDEDNEYVDIIYKNSGLGNKNSKKAGYLDKKGKFIEVSYNDLYSYKLDFNWLIKTITNELELFKYSPEMLVGNLLWRIGTIKAKSSVEIPVFFARGLSHNNSLNNIYKTLWDHKGLSKGIILTTSYSMPIGYNFPGNHQLISLRNCLIHDSNNFHIDKNIIKSAIGTNLTPERQKEGFSSGYRSGYFKGEEFTFTKKQAAIIEALDKHGGVMSKYELLAEADSEQYDVYRIFRVRNKKHPAWNVIIKNDGKGNYWLDY